MLKAAATHGPAFVLHYWFPVGLPLVVLARIKLLTASMQYLIILAAFAQVIFLGRIMCLSPVSPSMGILKVLLNFCGANSARIYSQINLIFFSVQSICWQRVPSGAEHFLFLIEAGAKKNLCAVPKVIFVLCGLLPFRRTPYDPIPTATVTVVLELFLLACSLSARPRIFSCSASVIAARTGLYPGFDHIEVDSAI